MDHLPFSVLAEKLPRYNEVVSAPRGRLAVAVEPSPFIPPPLVISEHALAAEVLLISAPAAVGKSTAARFLSAVRNAPLLDLSVVAVSTGTLQSLLSSLTTASPLEAFQSGKLPIIVDALDEGRLLSTDRGFEAFLETAGELLAMDRTVTNQPKLVLFGRPEAIELAETALQAGCPDITFGRPSLQFFDEEGARNVVQAFAIQAADAGAQFHKHPTRVSDSITAYFRAIEKALDLETGDLWVNRRGRAFAGYAPVLAALGEVLARVPNFETFINKLEQEGRREAWDVIMSVVDVITDRERLKVAEKLQAIGIATCPETYDSFEQLSGLVSHLEGSTLTPSRRAGLLKPSEQSRYAEMLNQHVSEHPFVRGREPANAVFAAIILAHGLVEGTLRGATSDLAESASRQPFLWRSFRRTPGANGLLDGQQLGPLLSSWANDPDTHTQFCFGHPAEGKDQGAVDIHVIEGSDEKANFKVTTPLRLYGKARGVFLFVPGVTVALASDGAFDCLEPVTISCGGLHVAARDVVIHGLLFVGTDLVTSTGRYTVRVQDDNRIFARGAIANTYPWSGHCTELLDRDANTGALVRLVDECMTRLPGTLVLNTDLTVTDDDRVKWIARDFPAVFPAMINVLLEQGFADRERLGSGGSAKTRVRFHFRWQELYQALSDPVYKGELRGIAQTLLATVQ